MKIKFIVLLMLIMLLASCNLNPENDKLVYTGIVEADEVKISSEIKGIISQIYIDEGQKIKKGDRIANIDVKDLEIQLKKAENGFKFAKAKLEELLKGARDEEIKNAKANVSRAEAQLEGAKKNYEYRLQNYNNLKELYKNGAISEQQLQDAKALLDSADTNVKSMKEQYEAVLAGLDLVLNGATENNIYIAKLDVERSEIEIENIKNEINKGTIISPKNGIVQTVNYREGELILPGAVIATIIDINNLWVKIYIPEKELHKVKLDDELKLIVSSKPDKPIKSKIIYISSEAEFTPKNVESKENKEEMVFEVKIKILDKDSLLKPGMLVDVELKEDK